MKKLRSMLTLVASTLIIIVGFALPAAGATSGVEPARALAAGQISSTDPCIQGYNCPGDPNYGKSQWVNCGTQDDPNNNHQCPQSPPNQ